MRTTKSRSSTNSSPPSPTRNSWVGSCPDKILLLSRLMSSNTRTFFEAAGSAEVQGHYTAARSAARTFCDIAAVVARGPAAVGGGGQTKSLNRRADSLAPHAGTARRIAIAAYGARLPPAPRGRGGGGPPPCFVCHLKCHI